MKNKPLRYRLPKVRTTLSFHVVVLQRTAKKCTKNYNVRAQLLFCSLKLLFRDVAVAVAVVVFLSSLNFSTTATSLQTLAAFLSLLTVRTVTLILTSLQRQRSLQRIPTAKITSGQHPVNQKRKFSLEPFIISFSLFLLVI